MKRTISALLAMVMVLAMLPGQMFAASYPQTYDVKFVLNDGTVIQSDENVSYVQSITAPEGYKDVEAWYCDELKMEVKNNEQIWVDDFGQDREVIFEAEAVLPESFTLNFVLPNGVKVGETMLDPENFLSFFNVPTVDGANVEWTAGNVKLNGGQMITGQDLDLDYVWYETNPVLNFELTSEATYPEAFTVRFIDDNDQVVYEETVTGWDFYWGINIPAGNWMCYRQRAIVSQYDYISGQTLDNDFTWYGEHPVVEFHAC